MPSRFLGRQQLTAFPRPLPAVILHIWAAGGGRYGLGLGPLCRYAGLLS